VPNPVAVDDAYADKADFDHIYDQPDPRAYYATLGRLGYEIPTHGVDVFRHVLPALGDDPTVLDLCCSYGVNAALLRHDVELAELFSHYADPAHAELTPGELLDVDREFYAGRRRPEAIEVIGLDAAANAIHYAVEAGILSDGIAVDLESGAPDPEIDTELARADLVTVTGGIGYIGEKTFDHILRAADDDPPMIAALSLRWVDFEPIAETLEDHGLVPELVDGYVAPQRDFSDDTEREAVMTGLHQLGLPLTHVEEQGRHGASLWLARTPEDVRDHPIDVVLADLRTPEPG
jgi:hypothetical protein